MDCYCHFFFYHSWLFSFWHSACLAFRMKSYSRKPLNNEILEISHQQTIWWMIAISPTTITESQNHYIIVHRVMYYSLLVNMNLANGSVAIEPLMPMINGEKTFFFLHIFSRFSLFSWFFLSDFDQFPLLCDIIGLEICNMFCVLYGSDNYGAVDSFLF